MLHVVLTVPEAEAEIGADRLWAAGARAVEERATDAGVSLIAVLADTAERSIGRLGPLPSHWTYETVDIDPEPDESWRTFAVPIEVNESLVLRPAWLPPSDAHGVTEIAIEPGASFGLGDHPTTRLSADAAWRLTRPGDRVLDVGCGSGVLGIVALQRGASHVTAIDIADAAVEATHDNAARNDVADQLVADATSLAEIEGTFGLVLANILAPVLVSLADDLRRVTAPTGRLVLAGILTERWDHVAGALEPMRVVETANSGEWASVVLSH